MNFGGLVQWALLFLVIALVASVFGFGGLEGTAMQAARILLLVAVIVLILSFFFGGFRRRL